jgi:hypothetical protein
MSKTVQISLHILCKLIFFCFLLLLGCVTNQDTSQAEISIQWKNGQATGFFIPLSLVNNITKETASSVVKVHLTKSQPKTAILGDYVIHNDTLIFEPLIPFTRGLRYEVVIDKHTLAEIEIPLSEDAPHLSGIYPSQDTLPENLLKFYFVFSQPMVEGHSLEYIKLINMEGDTLHRTFLNLQPELWNANRTTLTLWLDPGRIKRDLQPNKLLGNPLKKDSTYTLVVSNRWPDTQGATLIQSYSKRFIVAARDMASPKMDDWTLQTPQKQTNQPLKIEFKEALDYILLQNTLVVTDKNGNKIEGSIRIEAEEKQLHFIPKKPWSTGQYKLQIEDRLEDLSGNNLNRLFDRDVTNPETAPSNQKLFIRKWQVD